MNETALSLRQLLPEARFLNCRDFIASSVSADSRHVGHGDVFVAVPGSRLDGSAFVDDAIAGGAAAVVVQRAVSSCCVPQIIVPCAATAHAVISMALAVGDQQKSTVAGITGTNGKTTTSWVLHSILEAAGIRSGLTGTICRNDGVRSESSTMTTPPAQILAEHFKKMAAADTSHCVMEISSHALVQKRCAGVRLSAAAITNVTQDHFDYHKTEEAYRLAKAEIVNLLYPDAPLLLNADDEGCRDIMSRVEDCHRVVSYGIENPAAELQATVLSKTHRSQRVRLKLAQGDADVRLRLIGRHNVANCLAAAGLAEQLGVRLTHIVRGLEAIQNIPGRMERIDEGQCFQVFVDYAHTPDALAQCIDTIRNFAPGRLICVFGAGGDRDRGKRPLMAKAAMAADVAVVTSDNPRSEPPRQIIADIAAGFAPHFLHLPEVNREEGISRALELAEAGDVVIIAGKGHETTQTIGGVTQAFDDRLVIRQLLKDADVATVGELQPRFSVQGSA